MLIKLERARAQPPPIAHVPATSRVFSKARIHTMERIHRHPNITNRWSRYHRCITCGQMYNSETMCYLHVVGRHVFPASAPCPPSVRTAATCARELTRLRSLGARPRIAARLARLEAALPVFLRFEQVQGLLSTRRVRAIPINPYHVHRARVSALGDVTEVAQADG